MGKKKQVAEEDLIIPPQDGRICGTICICQMTLVLSTVAIVYLTVAIYVPGKSALRMVLMFLWLFVSTKQHTKHSVLRLWKHQSCARQRERCLKTAVIGDRAGNGVYQKEPVRVFKFSWIYETTAALYCFKSKWIIYSWLFNQRFDYKLTFTQLYRRGEQNMLRYRHRNGEKFYVHKRRV